MTLKTGKAEGEAGLLPYLGKHAFFSILLRGAFFQGKKSHLNKYRIAEVCQMCDDTAESGHQVKSCQQ